ncbi:MAG: hypothetical protein C4K58_06440 [Flavobacteriaceae bacterium]|nr:MAG: hypothetical protein C4K58_06440 [Flavobacteriaceae bacterium]
MSDYYKYNSKSKQYYHSALENVGSISDSLTKNKIKALIKASEKNYKGSISQIDTLLGTISDNKQSLGDYHEVLKVVLTLSEIEKFQKDNLPSKDKFERLTASQNTLIQKIKKFIPNF